jgi:hypothetical protein
MCSPAHAQGGARSETPTSLAPPTNSAGPTVDAADERPTEFSGVLTGGVVAPRATGSPTDGASQLSETESRRWSTQRNFAVLAVALAYDGFGLGVRSLGPRFGLDVSAGFHPVFATHSTDPEKFPKLRLLSAYQLNASFYLALHRSNRHTDVGLSLGYKYNTLVRHGVGAAFYLQREFAAHWALLFFAGPAVFPEAEARIRSKAGWRSGSVSSGMAWLQGGLGVSLAFYP